MNPYEVLKVPETADTKQIKASFRELSKELHPDAGGTKEAFTELHAAYVVLFDPEKRKKYDETGVIDGDAVRNDLSYMVKLLVEIFEIVLNNGEAFKEDIDLISLMRKRVKLALEEICEKIKTVQANLKALQRLRKRISSVDQEHNLFLNQIDLKVADAARIDGNLAITSRGLSMLNEELSNYTCMVEIVHTVNIFTRLVIDLNITGTNTS